MFKTVIADVKERIEFKKNPIIFYRTYTLIINYNSITLFEPLQRDTAVYRFKEYYPRYTAVLQRS